MLEYDERFPEQKTFVVNEMLSIFNKLFDMKVAGGPMFEQYFRNSVMLVLEVPANSTQTFDVFGDVGADIGNAVTTDFEVVYSSVGSSIKNVVSTPGNTVTSVAGDPVPAGI
jgi:hypothetical protein